MTTGTASTGTPIRVGIVGLSARGGWAAAAHLPALHAAGGFDVRALSAGTPDSTRAAARAHGVPLAYDDAASLAGSGEVDLVVVAVKVPYHRDLVDAVLGAGVPVLCEWPLAGTLAEAEAMAGEAQRRGVPAFTTLQSRAAPAVRYLRDLVADGYVGEVLSSTLVADGVNWGGRVDPSRLYQLDRDLGATMMTIPFGHTLDAVRAVLGEPSRVTATTAVRRPRQLNTATGALEPMTAEDQIAVTATLPGGGVLSAHMRGGRRREQSFRWEIEGTDGELVVTVDPPLLQLGRITIRGAHGTEDTLAELPVPQRYVLVPGPVDQGAWPVANLAHTYRHLHTTLTTGRPPADADVVPDFAGAVVLHRLLEDIRAAATKIEKAGGR